MTEWNEHMRKTIDGRRSMQRAALWLLAAGLAGCAAPPRGVDPVADRPAPPGLVATGSETAWQHRSFPGKAPTRFTPGMHEGRRVIEAQADRSASMLRQTLRVEPQALGLLRFSWRVPALIEAADLARREADDSPVRIVLAFEGDRSRFSARDAMLSELARTLTGEEMPYATLMYVWCNQCPLGTVIASPRTDRIRKLVVESGPQRLDQWLAYERDVRADFERVFGEPPGALVGMALMTDTDNTRSVARAWYGPVQLSPFGSAR